MSVAVGIIGGGQLGKMLAEALLAHRLTGYYPTVYVLDPSFDCPCAKIPKVNFMQGSLYDKTALKEFASYCDVLTYEIEHLNADCLIELEDSGKRIVPSPKILKTVQNKFDQKEMYKRLGIPTLPYAKLTTLEYADINFPNQKQVVLKRERRD